MSMIGQKSISSYDWLENNITRNLALQKDINDKNSFPIILP